MLAVFSSALLLTLLFYKQGIGLNLLLFDVIFLIWLFATHQINLKQKNVLISLVGYLSTAIFTIVSYTIYSYFIHFFALFIFIGVLNYDEVRSLLSAYGIAITSLPYSIASFFKRLFTAKVKGKNVSSAFYKARIFLIPIIVIFIFLVIYSNANDKFGSITSRVMTFIETGWNTLFKDIDFGMVSTYVLCLFISMFLLLRANNPFFTRIDKHAKEHLQRIRKRSPLASSILGLKREYKAAIFLLLILNVILLILNILDVYFVWFNFIWDGDTLKQFVHEGTWLLILSILISITIVLYYFRENLNFYAKNGFLRKLSYIWIAQNAVLVISVAIRNYRYIEYYALAYKRIGVILFLLLILYGLFTVYIKIKNKKTAFYLFRTNALALYVILVLSGFINWDGLIARYNVTHADQSYLHLSYLSNFSDKALPHLDISLDHLKEIKKHQGIKFYNQKDMNPNDFHTVIQNKKRDFKQKWEGKNWLAWNMAEYLAYKKLFE